MKDKYWEALIRGLTPETSNHVHMWWKIPTVVLLIFLISSIAI